ncbi:phosphotransferase [Thermoflavimicrobium daqui]|uniref:Aminoglycoside phosphotransferase domain-containing protein n=1 Tax=Thermoflavimicrobium daqui TaxID=2137476 RepID=A0A364K8N9_9BACL|nr:phosphotransferase [Thermoflavimicrobium daqui]RAL26665.1 hypothetical protein DL897_01035 [Thermoflavimicrobium daqui]
MSFTSNYNPSLTKVIQLYGWTPSKIQQFGKIWKITDRDGSIYALKKAKQSKAKLMVLHHMLEGVQEAGFSHLLPWISSQDEEPVVSVNDENWYATQWKQVDESQHLSSIQLIRSLGKLHHLAQAMVDPYPELATQISKEIPKEWKEKKEELFFLTKEGERQFCSPFEKVLEQKRDMIERNFDFAIRGLERFVETESGKAPRFTICHRRIHPSNVIVSGDQFYWIDFDHAQVDSPVRDVAMFLHRFVEQKGETQDLVRLLEAYQQENPLLPKEKRLLAIYLAYPERVIKTVRRYIAQPKLSTEADYVKKLDGEIQHIEAIQEVVQSLWSTKVRLGTKRSATDRTNEKSKGKRKK